MAKITQKYKVDTFEFIEDKIRMESAGALLGKSFEWSCQYFLMYSPKYRGMFKKIWLWNGE
jgi:hypothetical protein